MIAEVNIGQKARVVFAPSASELLKNVPGAAVAS